ncbi:MAG: hypothetical protein IJ323_01670 [Clostridia bacterium]|nr:hypothetical protein [Clostridia bacterium]
MKNINELKQYDFHDSLLEAINYNGNKLTLEIDFCHWKQSYYSDGDEETADVIMAFENICDFAMPQVKFNSDEIIEFNILNEKIEITAFNDIENITYSFVINSSLVEFNI